jgi:hypothetical protein
MEDTMRIYIIKGEAVVVAAKRPAKLGKGELAVGRVEELRQAKLSAARLKAIHNMLPGIRKLTKISDRNTLMEQLWTALEALPEPRKSSKKDAVAVGTPRRNTKQAEVVAPLRRPEGVTIDEIAAAMEWQRHTVRGVISGALKKKLGLDITAAHEERGRVYRLVAA